MNKILALLLTTVLSGCTFYKDSNGKEYFFKDKDLRITMWDKIEGSVDTPTIYEATYSLLSNDGATILCEGDGIQLMNIFLAQGRPFPPSVKVEGQFTFLFFGYGKIGGMEIKKMDNITLSPPLKIRCGVNKVLPVKGGKLVREGSRVKMFLGKEDK